MPDIINPLQAKLIPYIGSLKRSAMSGNQNAKEVISYYEDYVRFTSDAASSELLCESFLEDWKKETNNG